MWQTGQVGFGFEFESDESDQFDFLEEIKLDGIESGSIYILCFFRSLINLDLTVGHLILDQVRIRMSQMDFFF
jgi:hypothetical protein